MITAAETTAEKKDLFQDISRWLLAPLPIPLLQPVLHRIVVSVAQFHPELFRRLGAHRHKTWLIDPVNIPFILLLRPDPDKPELRASRRRQTLPPHNARIAGTFLTLLDMVDGRLDGDALFFTRDLVIEGDIEAVVTLRNALDDLEGSVMDDIAGLFGPPARMSLGLLRRIRAQKANA